MRIDVVTLFPGMFTGPLGEGLVGRALADGRAIVDFVDPRSFTTDRHHSVDDTPYGGGAGMLMKPEPLWAAVEAARARGAGDAWVVALTPAGRPLQQRDLERLAAREHVVLVAGRYEGMDERFLRRVDEELSLGDYVLTGGELGALVVIDGVVRLLPGTLGNPGSIAGDSFSAGVLEHAHYTRPPELWDEAVPEVLLGGDHAAIARWRRRDALARTRRRRPDLLVELAVDAADRAALAELPSAMPSVGVLVVPDPLEPLTRAEWAAWVRLVAAYELRILGVLTDEAPPASLGLDPRPPATPPESNRLRAQRQERERAARQRMEAARARVEVGARAVRVVEAALPDAMWLGVSLAPPVDSILGPAAARDRGRPIVLVVGPSPTPLVGHLPPIRASTAVRGLGRVATLAIALDRLIGER